MTRNMGNVDRAIRAAVALGIIYAYVYDYIPEKAGLVLLIIAGVFLITSLFAFCPAYRLFGISTSQRKKVNQ